jgi:hypothetical protein
VTVRAAAAGAVASLCLLGCLVATPAAAGAPERALSAVPCPKGKPAGPHIACTGPVTHHAGGGGGTLTIVLSAVVGVAIAVGGLLFVRRRLALDAARPRPPSRPRRPS